MSLVRKKKGDKKAATREEIRAYGVNRFKTPYLNSLGQIRLLENQTDGDITIIDSIEVILPKLTNGSDVIKRSEKPLEQYWELPKLPEDFDKNNALEKYIHITLRELERIKNGVFFYNKGVATYLTGEHYFYLTYYKLDDGGEPEFRYNDLKFFYHQQACINDPRCLGQIFIKNRRSGYSNRQNNCLIRSGILNENSGLGLVSKTGDDAEKMFAALVSSFRSLPFFLQPETDNNSNPKKILNFRERTKAKSKDDTYFDKMEGLNTYITWKSTTENAFDGYRLLRVVIDEAGKFDNKASVDRLFSVIKTCVIKGRKQVGNLFLGSTVNRASKGGNEFIELFNNSNPLERNETTGSTSTGLYGLFIPAQDAYEGCIDMYGFPVYEVNEGDEPSYDREGDLIMIGSMQDLEAKIIQLGDDSEAINEQKRQFPRTIQEAFRPEGGKNPYNADKIVSQLDYYNSLSEDPVMVGDFVWVEKYKKVKFVEHKDGRFYVAWLPEEKHQNKMEENLGFFKPKYAGDGIVSVDPVDHGITNDTKRFSHAAMHVFRGFDYSNEFASGNFVLEYNFRHNNPIDFYEDVLMVAIFYGYKILIENQKIGIKNHLEPLGFLPYFEKRPSNSIKGKVKQKEVGVPMNDFVASVMVEATQVFIDENVGFNPLREEYGKMVFYRTLEDWLKFEFDNRTKYDLSMSSGLALMWNMDKNQRLIKQSQRLKVNEDYVSGVDTNPLVRRYR